MKVEKPLKRMGFSVLASYCYGDIKKQGAMIHFAVVPKGIQFFYGRLRV